MASIFHKTTHRNRGFSLIEMLVYLAILVLITGAGVTTYLSLDTVLLRNKTERILTHSAGVALERMVRDIRDAEMISGTGSLFGTSPGALAVIDGPTTTRFYVSAGDVHMSINSVDQGPLTTDSVTVQNLTFTRFTTGDINLIRVALTLSASSTAASSTRTFHTSAILRGNYE